MPFSIHVNTPTKRAIAHDPACPEVPADPVKHGNNYWMLFPTHEETDVVRLAFVDKGYDAHWCECEPIRQMARMEIFRRVSGAG